MKIAIYTITVGAPDFPTIIFKDASTCCTSPQAMFSRCIADDQHSQPCTVSCAESFYSPSSTYWVGSRQVYVNRKGNYTIIKVRSPNLNCFSVEHGPLVRTTSHSRMNLPRMRSSRCSGFEWTSNDLRVRTHSWSQRQNRAGKMNFLRGDTSPYRRRCV